MKVSPRYDGPAIITIDDAPRSQREPFVRQRRRMAALLEQLGDDEWRAPSRCDGWTVQDVVAHLVGVNGFWRASVIAGLAGTPTRVLVNFDPAATPKLMVEPMRALAPRDVLAQFVESNETLIEVLAPLDDAGWSTLAESPVGHVPVRLIAQHGLWDAWVHERDIALPLGVQPVEEPDEVRACLRYAAALSPGFALSAGTPCTGEYAVDATEPGCRFALAVDGSVAVRDDRVPDTAPTLRGNAVDLVEALSLRTALPASTAPEWRALLAGLAGAFATDVRA